MEPLQIADKIKEKFPDAVVSASEYRGQAAVVLKKESILDVAGWLHDEPDMSMDLLKDLCGVDYLGKKEPRFEVVYHLYSIKHKHMIRLKAQVPEDPNVAAKAYREIHLPWHSRVMKKRNLPPIPSPQQFLEYWQKKMLSKKTD